MTPLLILQFSGNSLMKIWTSVWSAQYPKGGQNIQQPNNTRFDTIFLAVHLIFKDYWHLKCCIESILCDKKGERNS